MEYISGLSYIDKGDGSFLVSIDSDLEKFEFKLNGKSEIEIWELNKEYIKQTYSLDLNFLDVNEYYTIFTNLSNHVLEILYIPESVMNTWYAKRYKRENFKRINI